MFSSVHAPREGASAHELDRLWIAFRQFHEGLHHAHVQARNRGAGRAAHDRNVAYHEVAAQLETRERRQPIEQAAEVARYECLAVLPPCVFNPGSCRGGVTHVTKLGADRPEDHCEEVHPHCPVECGNYRAG